MKRRILLMKVFFIFCLFIYSENEAQTINLLVQDDVFTVTLTSDTKSITTDSVLDNDRLGTDTPTIQTVFLSEVSKSEKSFSFNALGKVVIPSTTPVGIYTLTYKLCERANRNNCAQAQVTIYVKPQPSKTLLVQDDVFTVTLTSDSKSITTDSVLDNDRLGTDTPTIQTVLLSKISGAFSLNAEGKVTLPSTTPVGIYTLTYKLCEKENRNNCAQAQVTIYVKPQPSKTLLVQEDVFTVTLTSDTKSITTDSVLDNDRLGTDTPTIQTVFLSEVSKSEKSFSFNALGKVVIPSTTPVGIYTLTYKLCEKENRNNCAQALVTIYVKPQPSKTLLVQDDVFTVTLTNDSKFITTDSVLDNDRLGTDTPTIQTVLLSKISGAFSLNAEGKVTLPSTTPIGIYTLTYKLCERTNRNNCAQAQVTIYVKPQLSKTLLVQDDIFTVTLTSDSKSITTDSVLDNDRLGTDTPTIQTVLLSKISGAFSLNAEGKVTLPSTTPVGIYTLTYKLCERGNRNNCAQAQVTIYVKPIHKVSIIANPDVFTYREESIVGNILDNDYFNERKISFSDCFISTEGEVSYIDLETGDVVVPSDILSGIYTMTYSLCAIDPIICVSTTVTLIVPNKTNSNSPKPIAIDDTITTFQNTSINIPILLNDTPYKAIPKLISHPKNGIANLNVEGEIEYQPNLSFIGSDSFKYELCNDENNCSSATITVNVIEKIQKINEIVLYNGISINNDEMNEYFHIENIEKYPNNRVQIYNHYGLKVFDIEGYDNKQHSFRGYSYGNIKIKTSLELSQDVYFYILEYTDEKGKRQLIKDWFYLKK